MYDMHAHKGASEAPRTHFRACKISKFSGSMPSTPPHTISSMDPTFRIWPGPTILLATLCIAIEFETSYGCNHPMNL